MTGFYFGVRERFPWRQQLHFFRRIAFGIGTAFAVYEVAHLSGTALKPGLSLAYLGREVTTSILAVLVISLGVPTIALMLTIALMKRMIQIFGVEPLVEAIRT